MGARFIGIGQRQIFAYYHEPRGGSAQDLGVVLCYPGPQEYMQNHWAFHRLAASLCEQGVHVLRFDYYGTGDSSGDGDAGTLPVWVDNIAQATQELRDLSGVMHVSLVGRRLGAALAFRASSASLNVRDLVLWEPVVHGGAYLTELKEMDAAFASRLLHHPPLMVSGPVPELLGATMSAANYHETADINLLQEALPRAVRVHLVNDGKDALQHELSGRLARECKRFNYREIVEDATSEANLMAARTQSTVVDMILGKGQRA